VTIHEWVEVRVILEALRRRPADLAPVIAMLPVGARARQRATIWRRLVRQARQVLLTVPPVEHVPVTAAPPSRPAPRARRIRVDEDEAAR
jgi:hypothetical protein